jgi:hypothetical protein
MLRAKQAHWFSIALLLNEMDNANRTGKQEWLP